MGLLFGFVSGGRGYLITNTAYFVIINGINYMEIETIFHSIRKRRRNVSLIFVDRLVSV